MQPLNDQTFSCFSYRRFAFMLYTGRNDECRCDTKSTLLCYIVQCCAILCNRSADERESIFQYRGAKPVLHSICCNKILYLISLTRRRSHRRHLSFSSLAIHFYRSRKYACSQTIVAKFSDFWFRYFFVIVR